jgi:hypothetical protein
MADASEHPTTGAEESRGETGFRPLTRSEQRNLWLRTYGQQDVALQLWLRLAEQQDLEFEVMFQMHGLLVFGMLISTRAYAQFHIDLYEGMYRQEAPDTADFLRDYYSALVPADDQPEIGPEGLPIVYQYVHLRDVTILSGGHRTRLPYWRGKVREIDAFVLGATPGSE